MSIQIKSGYINLLAMMSQNKAQSGKQIDIKTADSSNEMKKLQIKQQQLQNEMLLIKITGSDSTSNSAERLKLMKEKLEEVSNHIREVRKDTYISERSNPSPWQNLEDVKNSSILPEQIYSSVGSWASYFATEEEIVSGKDMTKTIIPLWFSKEIEALGEADTCAPSWREKAMRIAETYGRLRDEIVQEYADGTREVRIADKGASTADLKQGKGYHVLTMEEELKQLDETYEKWVNELEEHARQWPKQMETIPNDLSLYNVFHSFVNCQKELVGFYRLQNIMNCINIKSLKYIFAI